MIFPADLPFATRQATVLPAVPPTPRWAPARVAPLQPDARPRWGPRAVWAVLCRDCRMAAGHPWRCSGWWFHDDFMMVLWWFSYVNDVFLLVVEGFHENKIIDKLGYEWQYNGNVLETQSGILFVLKTFQELCRTIQIFSRVRMDFTGTYWNIKATYVHALPTIIPCCGIHTFLPRTTHTGHTYNIYNWI